MSGAATRTPLCADACHALGLCAEPTLRCHPMNRAVPHQSSPRRAHRPNGLWSRWAVYHGPPVNPALPCHHALAARGPTAAESSILMDPARQRRDGQAPSAEISSSRARCDQAPPGQSGAPFPPGFRPGWPRYGLRTRAVPSLCHRGIRLAQGQSSSRATRPIMSINLKKESISWCESSRRSRS